MLVTISQTTPSPPIQVAGDDIELRVWYTQNFVAGDGVTPVEGGTGQNGFYYSITCTKNGSDQVVIPAFTIQATTESNPTANFFGQLWVNGAPGQVIFGGASGWQLPTLFGATINYGQLALYNRVKRLLYPPATYPTFQQVIELINLYAGPQNYAGLNILGSTELSVAPVLASKPIAVGDNDTRVPTQAENDALVGTSGTPSSLNKYVTNDDPRFFDSLTNTRLAKTAAYTLVNADRGKTIALGGSAYYTLTVGAASGFDANFMVLLLNEDTVRAKKISANGVTDFFLYPGQTAILYSQNNAWRVYRNNRWKCPVGTVVYVDGTFGSDTNDGLAVGTGALATPQTAIDLIKANFDLANMGATPVIVQLADGTYTSAGTVIKVNGAFFGYQPTTATFPSVNEVPVMVRGNVGTPANVLLHSTSGVIGTFLAILGATVGVEGVKITSASGYGLRVAYATVIFGNIVLGECLLAKIFTTHFGLVENYSNFSIEGDSQNFIRCDNASSVFIISATLTLLTDITCAHFIVCQGNSDVTFGSVTINLNGHTVAGVRFAAQSGGSITTGTSSLTYFPGTVAGFVDGFGSYDNISIYNLVVDGSQTFQGRGTGNVMLGEWGFSDSYGALSFNGSLAAGNFNLAGSPGADTNFYINRETGGDIVFRENNAFSPSQLTLKNTTGRLGIGVDAPAAQLDVLGVMRSSGGVVIANTGKLNVAPKTNDTWGAAISLDVTISNHVIAAVFATSATATITPTAAGTAGDWIFIDTVNGAGGTVVVTFASTFHSSGTQSTQASRFSSIAFKSNGTVWIEQYRTTDLA